MKATREYYLRVRHLFIRMRLMREVNLLDIHFEVNFLYNKKGQLIKVI